MPAAVAGRAKERPSAAWEGLPNPQSHRQKTRKCKLADDEMEKYSRREFIKAIAGGTALLASFSLPREVFAKLEQLMNGREFLGESFEEGISRLHRDVYEKENERFYVYVKKGQIVGWLNIEDAMSLDMGNSIDLLPLLLDAEVEAMHFVHTHPLALMDVDRLLPPEKLQKIRETQRSDFPLVPSAQDIATLARQKRFLAEKNLPQKLSHSVVDPAGQWTYDVDLANPHANILSRYQKPIKDGERISDEELLVMSPEESAQFRLSLEMLDQQKRFYHDGIGMTDEKLEALKRWAREQWGVSLEFSAHRK